MREIWKDVKGYEGLYQVSNLGNVKSFKESAKLGKPKELILKPHLINSGYYVVTLYSKKNKRKFQVHRLVAETFIPNKEGLPCVNHKDENKLNNSVERTSFTNGNLKGSINAGRYTADYLQCGNLPYLAWENAHNCAGLSYRRIRRYLV